MAVDAEEGAGLTARARAKVRDEGEGETIQNTAMENQGDRRTLRSRIKSF